MASTCKAIMAYMSFRYFFSEGISTQSGEDVSNKEVKLRIKENS